MLLFPPSTKPQNEWMNAQSADGDGVLSNGLAKLVNATHVKFCRGISSSSPLALFARVFRTECLDRLFGSEVSHNLLFSITGSPVPSMQLTFYEPRCSLTSISGELVH
jgi:hypothetical protein